MDIYIYIFIYIIYMSIKLKQPTMRLATLFLFFFTVNLVMRWNGHVFSNSLNKMTNAANENAMRRCPRN